MRTRILWTTCLVLLALVSTTAAARPLAPSRERSDNTMTFTYDAVSGDIENAASSRTLTRNDRLEFFAMVRDNSEAEVGARLKAVAQLRLLGARAIQLSGTLTVVVQNEAGTTIESLQREIDIVLRDRKGRRSKQFHSNFDLPTGDYTVFGTFEK